MFSNRKWQQFALFLNLVGTAVLFYSFQATSSDFKLVTDVSESAIGGEIKQYALCVNNYTLLETDSHRSVSIGHQGCPNWQSARPAAVVNVEHPAFIEIGFITLLLGYLIQYLAVPQPKTVAALRLELKMLKAKERNLPK